MSADISETMDSSVEYLYMSDTEVVDERTKCGEIFVSLKSFDCVFFCIFCKDQFEYFSFDDFTSHVRRDHLMHGHNTQPPSPTDGFTSEVVQEDALADEKPDLDIAPEVEIEYAHWEKSTETGADEEWENAECGVTSENSFDIDLEYDVEMLTSDKDSTEDDDEHSIDQLEVNIASYRQRITEILDMYRKCIGLWHKKTAHNTSNEIQSATLTLMLEKYSTYYPHRTVYDLQDQLNKMKKRFNADYQRQKRDGVEPKLWYFKNLMFLRFADNEEISDQEFKDFNCPCCKNEVAGSTCSIDLWNHIITNHLKIQEDDPLASEQMRKIFTLQWPEDKILKFIDLYREHECLWNIKSRTYHNRTLKANAYKTLIETFNEMHPSILTDRESVKEAIRQLRVYFNRTLKKHQSADLLEVNWTTLPSKRAKINERLSFLRNVYMPKEQTYTCEMCGINFKTIKEFNSHAKSEHAGASYACDKCPLICRSQFKLDSHRKEHLRADDRKTYECPICHVNFENSDGLATHLNEHLSKKWQTQICEICGANFDDRSNLLIHIRRHTNTKNYVCSFCSKGFVTSTELKSHVVVHSNERPFVCETCGLRFKYSNRLNTHRLLHGEPKFKCNDCDMKFFTKRHLNDHQRMHAPADAPVVRISCDLCGSLFRNSDSLSRHRRKIHNIKVREQPNMRILC